MDFAGDTPLTYDLPSQPGPWREGLVGDTNPRPSAQDLSAQADAQIARAERIVAGALGWPPVDILGRFEVVQRQIARAKATQDPQRRLIEANAAVEAAAQAAGLQLEDSGPEGAPPVTGVAALSTWEKVEEALSRAVRLVPAGTLGELEHLLQGQNLWYVGAAIGIYGGLHYVGIGVIADMALAITGGLQMIRDAARLIPAARAAAAAETEQQLDEAAHLFASALSVLAMDLAAGAAIGRTLSYLKRVVPTRAEGITRARAAEGKPPVRPKTESDPRPKTEGKNEPKTERPESEPRPETDPRPRTEPRPGVLAGTGVLTAADAAQSAVSSVVRVAVPVGVVLALLALAIYLATRRKSSQGPAPSKGVAYA